MDKIKRIDFNKFSVISWLGILASIASLIALPYACSVAREAKQDTLEARALSQIAQEKIEDLKRSSEKGVKVINKTLESELKNATSTINNLKLKLEVITEARDEIRDDLRKATNERIQLQEGMDNANFEVATLNQSLNDANLLTNELSSIILSKNDQLISILQNIEYFQQMNNEKNTITLNNIIVDLNNQNTLLEQRLTNPQPSDSYENTQLIEKTNSISSEISNIIINNNTNRKSGVQIPEDFNLIKE